MMKNILKHIELIIFSTALVFSIAACGDVSGGSDSGYGRVTVINNTGSDVYFEVRRSDLPDTSAAVTGIWVWKYSERTTSRIRSGIRYFVAVTDFSGTNQMEKYNILYRSSSFILEDGVIEEFTYTGWSLSR